MTRKTARAGQKSGVLALNHRQHALFVVKKADPKTRTIEGMATTPTPDRMGDIVEPKGANFSLPLPLLWQHRHNEPVGNVVDAKVGDDGIWFKAKIEEIDEPGRLKDRLDEAWQSVVKGLVRGVSIGFAPTEPPEFMRNGGYRFNAWDWFELSLVTIPANADASIAAIKSAYSKSLVAARRTLAVPARAPLIPGVSGLVKTTTTQKDKATMATKTAAERIRELEDQIAGHQARMQEIDATAQGEERGLTDEEGAELDAESEQIAGLRVQLRRIKAAYGVADNDDAPSRPQGTVKRIRPSDGGDPAAASAARGRDTVPAQVATQEEKGLGFARLVMSFATAKGNHREAVDIAKARYGADSPTTKAMQLIARAAVTGGTTTDPSWAAPLVNPQNLVTEFVSYLRPRTIIGRFGQDGIPALRQVPFNIQVPVQTSGGTAQWVGEGAGAPLTKFDWTQLTLRWHKVAAIAVMTDELLRNSSPSAEVMVRDSLAESVIARLDSDIVNPSITETADVRPAALNNGAQTYTTLGPTAADVRADIKRLMSYFITNNIDTSSVVLIMRQAQALSLSLMRTALGVKEFADMTANGGFLEGIPVIASQHVAAGVVTAVCASEIYLADDGGIAIDMSREASLQMDSAPTINVSDGSPLAPTAASMVSMWQSGSVALKAVRVLTWKRRRSQAVVYQTGTSWGSDDTSPPPAAI